MTDYVWPDDLVPFAVSFYLQPHSGGSESPFSRATKVYGLSAPRWICRMEFRGGASAAWGDEGAARYGPRLDAMIARLKGRQNRALIYDFRRDRMASPVWPSNAGNSAAGAGATSMTITGLRPGTRVSAGDYIGGDGRPHIVLDDVYANASGQALVSFEPPLRSAVSANAAIFGNPTGIFRLAGDDMGANMAAVGELTHYSLEFVEDVEA